MNYNPVWKVVIAAVASLTVLASCGGGNVNISSGGIGGTGISNGTITGFGSVFVNGVEYDVSSAAIRMEGNSALESDLRVGMVVKVYYAAGKATLIEYNNKMEGVVQSVDVATNHIVVMDQTVAVDSLTIFDGTTLATLVTNNIVEVSGWADASGVIHATRIALKKANFVAGTDMLEIKGTIANLNTLIHTFTLGSLNVYYDGLGVNLSNGQYVEVKSTLGFNTGNQLIASAIEVKDNSLGAVEGDDVEIEGLVTDFKSSSDFSVNGQKITATTSTKFENGTVSDLTNGARVEVEGVLNVSGVLEADKVSFRQTGKVELNGTVQSKDMTAGTITVLGVTVKVTNLTERRDQSNEDVRRFSLTDIKVGDQVQLVAYQSGTDMIASRLERDDPATETTLQGPVTTVTPPDHLTVLGISIVTDGTTTFEIGGNDKTAIEFFAAVTPSTVVKAEGTLNDSGDTLTATKVQIED